MNKIVHSISVGFNHAVFSLAMLIMDIDDDELISSREFTDPPCVTAGVATHLGVALVALV